MSLVAGLGCRRGAPADAIAAALAAALHAAGRTPAALTGLPSLAEAAALAAAGPGARLLGPRQSARGLATCALATPEPAP